MEEIWVTKQKITESCIIQLSIQICCLNQKKEGPAGPSTRCTGYEKDYSSFSYSLNRSLTSREMFLARYSIVSLIPDRAFTRPLMAGACFMAILQIPRIIGTSTVRTYVLSLLMYTYTPDTDIPWIDLQICLIRRSEP